MGDDDIFQIGMIGLWKAVKIFDESKGNKFSTLAYKTIYNEIFNELRKSTSASRIPTDCIESLDEEIFEDSHTTKYDNLCSPEEINYQAYIDEFKQTLKGDKRIIFELLLNYSSKQKDIAEKLGVSKQYVSVSIQDIKKQFKAKYFGGD